MNPYNRLHHSAVKKHKSHIHSEPFRSNTSVPNIYNIIQCPECKSYDVYAREDGTQTFQCKQYHHTFHRCHVHIHKINNGVGSRINAPRKFCSCLSGGWGSAWQ